MDFSKRYLTGALLLILFALSNAQAQDNIQPDRPGLGNGAYVIHPEVAYLESGIEYYNLDVGNQYSFGQVLLRGGLTKGIELRMVLNSFVIQNIASTTGSGIPDPGFGIKFNLYNNPVSNIRLSGMGSLSIPIGSEYYSSDEWVPSTTVIANYSLSEYTSVTTNVGYTFGVGSLPDAWQISVTPGFSVPSQPDWGFYSGYAGIFSDSGNQHFIEAGITRHLAPYLQLDVNAGYNAENAEFFVGGGIALKFIEQTP